MTKLPRTFSELEGSAKDVARRLLGCMLKCTINNEIVNVKIVETEAYDETDAASHSFNGRTPRTDVMFGTSGHLYVYFTYGMHYCCNIVTGKEGEGSAVLIRAVEPLGHIDTLEAKRGRQGVEVTNGPAKLCQALGITKDLNGHSLSQPPLQLIFNAPLTQESIVTTTRIGITKDSDRPWRFLIKDNPYVSRPAV